MQTDSTLHEIQIHGHCDSYFFSVKDVFAANFRSRSDVGASFAATVDGNFVIDIWAGYADAGRTRPWTRDTLACLYSTTKTMTALSALVLVDRGQLDLDAPVARYWPEFAQGGKEELPVKYLLSHQSGLAGIDAQIPAEALYDWDRIVGVLAAQKPWWTPGTRCGYHALTQGYLVGEVIRRITGRTVYREHVGERYGRYRGDAPKPVLWVHAVSLGETRAAGPLVDRMRRAHPGATVLLTHMTATGRASGRALFGDSVVQAWLPYDVPFAVRSFLAHFRPRAGLIMETELWPNLVALAHAAEVPLYLVNARLSARSARGYARVPSLARPMLAALSGVAVQTQVDAKRLADLGAPSPVVTGNPCN